MSQLPEGKAPSASQTVMSDLVLPNDTNGLGNLMGGRLLHWMDVCAAISAQRHAGVVSVTASVDTVEFHSPILQSEIVTLHSWVNRAFRTSMEVEIAVHAENPRTGSKRKANRAFFTFVAVGPDGTPVPVPPVIPGTDAEHEAFEDAGRRRQFRLFQAGRLGDADIRSLQEYMGSLRDTQ